MSINGILRAGLGALVTRSRVPSVQRRVPKVITSESRATARKVSGKLGKSLLIKYGEIWMNYMIKEEGKKKMEKGGESRSYEEEKSDIWVKRVQLTNEKPSSNYTRSSTTNSTPPSLAYLTLSDSCGTGYHPVFLPLLSIDLGALLRSNFITTKNG